MLQAAVNGDLDSLLPAVQNGQDPNSTDRFCRTAAWHAAAATQQNFKQVGQMGFKLACAVHSEQSTPGMLIQVFCAAWVWGKLCLRSANMRRPAGFLRKVVTCCDCRTGFAVSLSKAETRECAWQPSFECRCAIPVCFGYQCTSYSLVALKVLSDSDQVNQVRHEREVVVGTANFSWS